MGLSSAVTGGLIGGAGAIGGALISSGAASDAASAQQQAAQQASATQLQMFNQTQQNLSPYYTMGANALGTLASNLGIGSYSSAPQAAPQSSTYAMPAQQMAAPQSASQSPSQSTQQPAGTQAPWTIANLAGTPGVGGSSSYAQLPLPPGADMKGQVVPWAGLHGSTSGTQASPATIAAAQATEQRIAQADGLNIPQALPIAQPGSAAQTSQQSPIFTPSSGGSKFQLPGAFTNADLNANLAPNYQFQLNQGQMALQNSQAADTGVLSGAALKGMQNYVQGTAAGAYQNAYSNWLSTQGLNLSAQNQNYNQIYNLASLGENAAATTGNQAVQTGSNIGSNIIGGANAQAASTIAGANAISGGINNAGGYYMLNNLLGGGSTAAADGGGGNVGLDPSTISSLGNPMSGFQSNIFSGQSL